jgi:hypothetical protein
MDFSKGYILAKLHSYGLLDSNTTDLAGTINKTKKRKHCMQEHRFVGK